MAAGSYRHQIKFGIKLVVGSALIYYVFRSKMVDFETLRVVLFNPVNLIVSFGFLMFSALCCACRWFLLVRAQGLALSFKNLIELTMIGNFFNTFMPGAVGGDLIKAWYVAGREPQRKTRAIFTVLLDRAIGLSVIIFYSAVTLLFYFDWLKTHPELAAIAWIVWAFTGTSIVVGVVFFSPLLYETRIFSRTIGWLRRSVALAKVIDAAFLYRHHFGSIIAALLLSAASVLGTNVFYNLQGSALGISLGLSEYFVIVPLALTVSAVPLLPGGIGVGQVAFFTLFKWMGMPNPEQGSTLCTLMQVYTLLFNCLGAYFYVRFKRHPGAASSAMDVGTRSPIESHIAFVPEPS